MNRNFWTNCILFLILAAAVYFGITIVNALDRVRQSQERLSESIRSLEEKMRRVPTPGTNAGPEKAKRDIASAPAANAQFFVPDAPSGGRLIQALQADPGNLNPILSNEASASAINSFCNDSLASRSFSEPEKWEPQLAESWTVSPDYKTYRIKLRKGVYFHDFTDPDTGKRVPGVEVTAADFKFTLDAVRDKSVNCEALRIYYQDVKSVELHSRYEFSVHWKKSIYTSLSATLSLSPLPEFFYHAYPGKFDGKRFNHDFRRNRMIVGCGPYQFVRWDKDARIVLKRFENYYGKTLGIAPKLDFLVYEIIKHPNTRFQSLMGGTLDNLSLTPEQYRNRTGTPEFQNGKLRKFQYLQPQFTYIGYNLKNPLFQDRRVRQALTMLVDREKILREIYFGLGEIVTGPFFPKSACHDSRLKPYPYDPEKAKKLLAEAGWRDVDNDGILEKDGRKFEFTIMQIASSPIQMRMFPVIKESLAAAGIDMKIRNMEWSVYVQRLEEKNFEACCLGWLSSFDPDMYQIWHSSQADLPGSSNHIAFKNKRADELIEEMRVTFDMKKRIALAHEFERLLHEEQPYTFLFAPMSLEAFSGRYRNLRVFPAGIPTQILYVPKNEQKTISF